jgi:hypothetical protein
MVFALLPAPSRVVYPSRRLPENSRRLVDPDIAARASGMSIIKDQALHDRWNFVSLHLPGYPPIIDPSPDIDSRASTAPPNRGITNLNRAGMSAGERPLRFLNPWLCGDGHKALIDIADGASISCNRVILYVSQNSMTGWGPATGLGHAESPKNSAIRTH